MIQFGLRLHDAEKLPMEQVLPLVRQKGFTCAHLALSKAMKEYPCDPSALTPGYAMYLRNLFARTPVWVLIALAITLFSRNPRRASLNVLLFLVGVIGSYCLFSYLREGRLPDQHNLLLWGIVTAASALVAFGVWYARCRGLLGTAISAVIIAYFILQIFSFTANFSHFDLSYGLAEVFILIAVIMMLYDGIVSCLISVGAAIALAYLVKLTGFSIPYVL